MFGLPGLGALVGQLARHGSVQKWARALHTCRAKHCDSLFDEMTQSSIWNGSALWVPSGCGLKGGRVVGEPRARRCQLPRFRASQRPISRGAASLEKYATAIQDCRDARSEVEIKSTQ